MGVGEKGLKHCPVIQGVGGSAPETLEGVGDN